MMKNYKMILGFLLFLSFISCTTTPQLKNTPLPLEASKHFERVILIIMENEDYPDAIHNSYLKELAQQGALFTNFHAVDHPSYPNYMAMTGGETFGIKNDNQIIIDQKSIGDLLSEKNLHWKNYAEDFPGRCFLGDTFKRYARKHVPMISYKNVQSHPEECKKIGSGDDFQKDWKSNQLPEYSFYTPDMDHDAHDKSLDFAGKWLKKFLSPILIDAEKMKGTLVILTFDESSRNEPSNQIYTLMVGPMVKKNVQNSTYLNHYDVLRTIEDNFNLGTLNKSDLTAHAITGVWSN